MTNSTHTRSSTLTQRQTEVLQVIRQHIESTGAPPTRAEIAKQLGFKSVNAAEDHLKALARKGAILLSPGTSRGIQLTEKHGLGLPIVKDIQNTSSIFNEKNFSGRLRIQNEFFNPKPDFLFQIQGLALTQAGIKDGDLLAIHACNEAKPGQLVLVKVHQNVMIRRYQLENGQITLKAEHPDFEAITVQTTDPNWKIEGVVVGVIRKNPF